MNSLLSICKNSPQDAKTIYEMLGNTDHIDAETFAMARANVKDLDLLYEIACKRFNSRKPLLEAIKNNEDVTPFLDRNNDVDECLLYVLMYKSHRKDLIEKLIPYAITFNGCLREAIIKRTNDEELLYTLLFLSNDVGDSLLYAIKYKPDDIGFIHSVFNKTKDFRMCLYEAIQYNRSLVPLLLPATKDFTGCLRRAIQYAPHDKMLMNLLFPHTKDFESCFYTAMLMVPWDSELIVNLIEEMDVVDNRHMSFLFKSKPFNRTVFYAMIENITDFEGVLENAISNYNLHYDSAIIDYIYTKTTDFDGCLKASLTNIPAYDDLNNRLFDETSDFTDCLYMALRNCPNNKELVENLFTNTKDYTGCLDMALYFSPDNAEIIEKLKQK